MPAVICPGCNASLPGKNLPASENYNAAGECEELFNELSGFTLSLNDSEFIHQHIVDAYGAQHAGPPTKNIRVAFSLIGLCLAVENNYTGRQVQLVHMKIPKQTWELPGKPLHSEITIADVMRVPDNEKKQLIFDWMKAVWQSWSPHHEWIRETMAKR
jgi:hypothetical protein